MKDAKLLIEHNATDEDTGFQGFADGEPWNELKMKAPSDDGILTVNAEGGLFDFGLTELFFETSEPPNAEVPIENVLARLNEGNYAMTGDIVDGESSSISATFTQAIPTGPVLISPAEDAENVDPTNVVVAWDPVTKALDGTNVDIVGYQVIVEENVEQVFDQGFAKPVFNIYLPSSASSVKVPAAFMVADTCYKYEVLAIEASGNQTLATAEFATGPACEIEEPAEEPAPMLSAAKILIEHNATDEDTGFQGFGDGDPWNSLTVNGPGDQPIVLVNPEGGLFNFGLTEFFFETSEPENAEVPIDDVLARLPEGDYTFVGDMVDGGQSILTATFTHAIPAGPEVSSPEDGADDVDPNAVVVSWQPVDTDIDGESLEIIGYQVIVELDEEQEFPSGFSKPKYSVYLPASATSIGVPQGLLESGKPYNCEVFAIEESGNQSFTLVQFKTR